MRRADRIGAILLLLFAAGYAVGGRQHAYWGPNGPGPGFLPLWLAGVMAGLALILLVQALRAESPGAPWLPRGPGLRRLGLVLGATAVLTASLSLLGMILGTALYLTVVLRLVEGHPWRLSLAVAAGTSLVNYLVFTCWLRVPFPVSVLGF